MNESMNKIEDREGRSWAKRAWVLLSCAFLLAANLFLFSPLNVYLGNVKEFEVGYFDIARVYLFPFLFTILFLVILGFLFKGHGWERYASFLFGLGILSWIQGSILVWNYGVLDARGIDWELPGHFVWLDIFIWIAVLFLAVLGRKRIVRIVALTCWTLVALQTLSLVWQVNKVAGDFPQKMNPEQNQPPEAIFQYSPHRNILHIILDSLQTDVFLEVAQETGLRKEMEGFVLFRGNAGVAPYTSFAIPALFSGRLYDDTTSEHDYYLNAMKHGFQDRLYQEGYRVNIIPEISMENSRYTNYFYIPDDYRGSRSDIVRKKAAFLFDIALFRQVPHLLKKRIYNQNKWFITSWNYEPEDFRSIQQKAFFRNYIKNLNVHGDAPTYTFIHLWPP